MTIVEYALIALVLVQTLHLLAVCLQLWATLVEAKKMTSMLAANNAIDAEDREEKRVDWEKLRREIDPPDLAPVVDIDKPPEGP